MASNEKPSTSRGTASEAEQLRAMKEFPGLDEMLAFVRNLVMSLKQNREEDESNGTMNRSDAEKLGKLYGAYVDKFKNKICRQMIGDELAEADAVSIMMEYMNILTKDGSDYPLDGNNDICRQMIGDKLAEAEAMSILMEYMNILTKDGSDYPLNMSDDESDENDDESEDDGSEDNEYNHGCYEIIRGILCNYTDASPNLCKQVARKGMLKMLLYDLKYFQKTFKSDDQKRYIVMSAMTIFNNCSSVSENIKYFREIKAVPTVEWYAKNTGQELEDGLTIASMMTLSYIVDDGNNDILLTDESIIETFLKLLQETLENSDGRYKGFTTVELVRALTRLANNNKNSATMVKKKILNSLLKMMEGDEENKFVATEALWGLAFADVNKKKIETFQDGKFMEYLQTFSNSQSTELQKAAKGALWVLALAKNAQEKQQQSQASKQKCEGHVMISYQWDCQETMKQVRDCLKLKGINVWIDIDCMKGNILDEMAHAVENASVVLVCLSQKYKDSHSCRTEGQYVYSTEKPIIPVLVEEKYKADGWLGLLVGSKLYYDLSDPQKFKDNISKLVKALSNKEYLG